MIRVAQIWTPSDGIASLDLLHRWAPQEHLSTTGACVWVPDQHVDKFPQLFRQRFCFHIFRINPAIDRYERVPSPSLRWSPWGIKSGPNFQFFTVLRESHAVHGEHQLLLVEPDTYPMNEARNKLTRRVTDVPTANWVFGARVHPWSRRALAPILHDHINGHALYALSQGFMSFLEFVWIPSLLLLTRKYDEFAFDCLTPQVVEEELPASLRDDWEANYARFTTSPTMVNASNLRIRDVSELRDLVGAHLADGRTNPDGIDFMDVVSVHVKGYPTILKDLDNFAV